MVFIKKNFEWYEELLQKASEEEWRGMVLRWYKYGWRLNV
jgi:hypothetical protein